MSCSSSVFLDECYHASKFTLLHPWVCAGRVWPIPEMPSKCLSFCAGGKYVALISNHQLSLTPHSSALHEPLYWADAKDLTSLCSVLSLAVTANLAKRKEKWPCHGLSCLGLLFCFLEFNLTQVSGNEWNTCQNSTRMNFQRLWNTVFSIQLPFPCKISCARSLCPYSYQHFLSPGKKIAPLRPA